MSASPDEQYIWMSATGTKRSVTSNSAKFLKEKPFMSIKKLLLAATIAAFATTIAAAEVVRIEITEKSPVLDGKSFGKTGPYDRLVGKVHFEVDPKNDANRRVSDIDYAPLNSRGRVEFSADLYLLVPRDPAKGNGSVFYEVVNRGRKGALNKFNLGSGSFDPRTADDFGDGLMLREGFTIVWMGWQYDVPPEPGLMQFFTPTARDGDKPITGLVRSDFVPDAPMHSFHLADRRHFPYAVLDPDDPEIRLTVRDRIDAPRKVIPRDEWIFATEKDGKPLPNRTHVYVKKGLIPGKIYEIVYRAQDPKVIGLGLSATRDLMSFLKHGGGENYDGPLAGYHRNIQRAIGFGSSQSGRFLRTFLYFGFNKDEHGRQSFDGLWPHVAGGGRGSFNHRFAQPSRDARPHFNFLYPTDIYPFTDVPIEDPETGRKEGILSRTFEQEVAARIFYTNSSYEYYGRSASLIHTTPDGESDAPLHDGTRIYMFSGSQHGAGTFPPGGRGTQNPANANDYRWGMRGLLLALNDWVSGKSEPPASQYPRMSEHQLVPLAEMRFPNIPGVEIPKRMHHGYRVDYGPEFLSKGIVTIEPPKVGKEFRMFVPQVKDDGNETSGIAMPVIQAPLASYMGWNLRAPEIGAPKELYSMRGSYVTFPKTAEDREKSGDPRPSIEERYENRRVYLEQISEASRKLALDGYILPRDIAGIVRQAADQWDYHMKKN